MKTTKRIISMIVVMAMALSFALVSVSALPADYSAAKGYYEFTDFESGLPSSPAFANDGNRTIGLSTAFAHSGDSSMKINGYSDGSDFSKFFYTTGLTLEANTTYYVSFWYYSEDNAFSTTLVTAPAGATKGTISYSGTAKNQWNKVWYTFTTGSSVSTKYFTNGIWGMGTGKCGYIDDFEFAKLEDADYDYNEIPDDAVASATVYKNLEDQKTDGITQYDQSTQTKSTSAEYAHWGNISMEYVGNGAENASTGFYMNATSFFGSDFALEANKTYYLSYYIYSPEKAIRHSTHLINAHTIVPTFDIPADEWTRVEAVFTVGQDTMDSANNQLLRVTVTDSQDSPVYFDDFVFAKLSQAPAEATLEEVAVDYESGIATVTFKSSLELKSVVSVTAPEGVTVEDSALEDDAITLTVDLSGVDFGAECDLTITVTDKYSRVTEVAASFEMPSAGAVDMSITSSSIADGATDVLSPVDALYFTVGYPIVEDTLTDSVTIEGFGASVTAVELLDATTVKVSLDGIFPEQTYIILIDGIKNEEGGVLTDSITFTTKKDWQSVLSYNFNEETIPSNISKDYGATMELSPEQTYTGSQSLKLTRASDLSLARIGISQSAKKDTNYIITAYVYAETWGGSTQYSTWGTWGTPVVTDAEKTGWKKVQIPYYSGTYTGMALGFYNLGTSGTIYVDDIEIKEAGFVSNPVMTNNGEYVTSIAADDTNISFTLRNADVNNNVTYTAYIIGYEDAANSSGVVVSTKMSSVIDTIKGTVTKAGTVDFNLTLAGGNASKIKIIILNEATYAPVCNAIELN